MGNQNNGAARNPGPEMTATVPSRIPPSSSSSVIFPNNGTTVNTVAPTTPNYLATTSMQIGGLPSSAYQMFSLQPTRTDTPETLLERLNATIDEACNEQRDNISAAITTLPLVLDLAAFHPDGSPHHLPVEGGTLTQMVDAIRTHQAAQSNGEIGFCLVGVTNLPPCDQSMAAEANILRLPVFHGGNNDQHNKLHAAPALQHSHASSTRTMPRRNQRGGVVPLLRQRRPGVATTEIELHQLCLQNMMTHQQ